MKNRLCVPAFAFALALAQIGCSCDPQNPADGRPRTGNPDKPRVGLGADKYDDNSAKDTSKIRSGLSIQDSVHKKH